MTLYKFRLAPHAQSLEDAHAIDRLRYGWDYLEQAISLWRLVDSARAVALASRLAGAAGPNASVVGRGLEGLDAESADGSLLINATSAGLSDARLPIADAVFSAAAFAYDMVYGARPTAFLVQAATLGCPRQADGLGMLVEQAAESFRLWRGVAPQTDPVYRQLRDEIGRA